jgi:type VI secretion system secreted protein Hcp
MWRAIMAFDAYLKFEDPKVEGESTDKAHSGEFEIESFSFGASNPVTIGSGTTGAAAGRVQMHPLSIVKKTDKASPILLKMCAAGEHFKKATLTLRKGAGEKTGQQEYLKYHMELVYVDSLDWSGSTGGDDTPTESLNLSYGQMKIEYKPQKADGTLDAAIEGGWDLRSNTAV